MKFGLTLNDIQKIRAVFASYEEVEKVIIYGSRAKGNYKPASDIDLTVFGERVSLTAQQEIENELENLLLPYTFDISTYHQISNNELVEHINRVGKLFYEKPVKNPAAII